MPVLFALGNGLNINAFFGGVKCAVFGNHSDTHHQNLSKDCWVLADFSIDEKIDAESLSKDFLHGLLSGSTRIDGLILSSVGLAWRQIISSNRSALG